MNLHSVRPKPTDTMGFMVHASNIHTDESETYGPFPGQPQMTYEFLRVWHDLPDVAGPDHVFSYAERRNDYIPGHPNAATWTDQEGETRGDGWRRCYDREADGIGQFGVEHGPFWTDLTIETKWFETEPRWESNLYPETQ